MSPMERPLSPHLQIYRPQITSVLSIAHRLTGVALTLGTLLLTWWLVSAAYGPNAFADAQAFVGSWVGQVLLWAFTFALFYHLGNGIRHLAWDFGWGFELSELRASAIAMLAFAAAGSLLTLIVAYATRG